MQNHEKRAYMVINKATKCRIYPNKEQQHKIALTLGCCRYVYNHMLSRNERIYKRRGEHLGYNDMQNLLPKMKEYLPWLKEADSQALKYACRQLDDAYKRFFKGSGKPKYKRKRGRQGYTTTNGKTIHVELKGGRKGRVKLPTIGWVKVRGINIPENTPIIKATVSQDPDGKYYVSLSYRQETEANNALPDIKTVKAIGLDFREGDLYCDSDGESAGKPNNVMASMARLKKAQDKLSRMIESHITGYKVIGKKRYPIYDKPLWRCRNIQKQRRRIAKIHKHIANQRKDFLHKQSIAITKQYDVICTETLKVANLLMDKGSDPSAKKRRNINRKVYDDGWYMFTQMLEYKSAWQGKHYIKVPEDYPSTETCNSCGRMEPSLKDLTVREWTCPACGMEHDRDHNAAMNIKTEGLRLLYAA